MLTALLSFWTHVLAAAMFTALALWRMRDVRGAPGGRLLVAGLAATALWAWSVAVEGAPALIAPPLETTRNLVWLALLGVLMRGDGHGARSHGGRVVVAGLAAVGVLQLLLDLVMLLAGPAPAAAAAIASTTGILRVTAAAGALVLVHNVYGQAAPAAKGAIRLPMLGLAALWIYDLNLYTVAVLTDAHPDEIVAMRGAIAALTTPLFALASREAGDWRIRPSRAATFQTLSIGAILAYFLVMTIGTGAGEATGWVWLRSAQLVLLIAMTVAAAVLIPSGRARAWLRVTLTKHLFQHRYDYRGEWLRFTGLMSEAGPDAAPLGQRAVKAIADIVEAPAGLLLVPGDGGRLEEAAQWNWPDRWADTGDHAELVAALAGNGRVLDFAARREGRASGGDRDVPVPAGWEDRQALWAGVPLVHDGRLIGLVLLAAPSFRRALDWEDFDLLRTAARGAASYLAEARGQEALSEAARFDEFNRRFAFILHDIKNLVSGLSLVARNAERHADNPEFRADMVATLRSSVERMNDLLAKLSPHESARTEALRPALLAPLLTRVVAAKARRHDVRLTGGGEALADPFRLEQAVIHLLDNAIDASPSHEAVRVEVAQANDAVTIRVIDRGAGMPVDFVRTRLFQPFASTKTGGFGIGAHQARALIAGMGGTLRVDSREGQGTCFTITLPAARPKELAA
ncbi:MAG TPA: XrtA/PEP-CTERM system histidine kinase PrsK [Sphingomonadaceae bacterium]|nr:XrtA/PEP-CTERM system histidine kinase PrsK [Sphingomonadaceae bacterium]